MDSEHTFIIYVKVDRIDIADKQFKIVIFEQATSYEETFNYETQQIFTKDEIAILQNALKDSNEKKIKEIFVKVVEKKLKIRLAGEDLQVISQGKSFQPRYIAYFLEAAAMAPEGPDNTFHSKWRDQKFDIRNGFRYMLTEPDSILLAEKEHLPEEK